MLELRVQLEKPNICLSKYMKNILKIRGILYNWETTELVRWGILEIGINKYTLMTTSSAITVSFQDYCEKCLLTLKYV